MLTLITGGARSGKSRLAEKLVSVGNQPVTYVASARITDPEMEARVKEHQERRPSGWTTLEAPLFSADQAAGLPANHCILFDCLTNWTANQLDEYRRAAAEPVQEGTRSVSETALRNTLSGLLDPLLDQLESQPAVVIVTNEVGSGIVPSYPSGRRFRDAVGWLNQRVAGRAGRVILSAAGQPLVLKGPPLPENLP